MYHEFFGLKHRPFNHGPAEQFFCPNDSARTAIARLRQVLTARHSLAVVSGGPGVGKSALVEQAILASGPDTRTAHLDLRQAEGEDLVTALLLALDPALDPPGTTRAAGMLRHCLGQETDKAQRMAITLDVNGLSLEIAKGLLRLVHLAGDQGCQLNIVIQGPHTLHQQLDVPALIPLRQRIAYRYRARPLTLEETGHYIREQLKAAGGDPDTIIGSTVPVAIYCYVAGVPRLINTLMDATLCEAQLQGVTRPDGNMIKLAADGLGWRPLTPHSEPATNEARPQARAVRPQPASVPRSVVNNSGILPVAAVPAATEAASFGNAIVPMDPEDPAATGMLELRELEARFATSALVDESPQAGAQAGA